MEQVVQPLISCVASAPSTTYTQDDLALLNFSGRKIYHTQGYKGQNVIVAVIDTGVSDHPELSGRLLPGINTHRGYVTPASTKDDFNHGTWCAAAIAGKNVGIAPEAKIVPIKCLDGVGCGTPEYVIAALNYVLNWRDPSGNRVDIVSMSLAFGLISFPNPNLLMEFEAAIDRLINTGIIVIAAAGNTGIETILYPAYFNGPITVGAVDRLRKAAYFTTKSKQVDVCQIGVDIIGANNTGGYIKMSGTSMATPVVAGITALLVSKYKALNSDYMPEKELYTMLKMSTVDLDILGVDITTGAGFCTLQPMTGKFKIGLHSVYNFPNTNISYKPGCFTLNGVDVIPNIPPCAVNGRILAGGRDILDQIGGVTSYDAATNTGYFEI